MDILKSILHLIPDAKCIITSNDYSQIEWLDDRLQPTLVELEAIQNELTSTIPKSWDLLIQKLLASSIYMKAYYLSKDSLPIAQGFNKVEQILLITKNEAALGFFLDDLLQEIRTYITPEELAEVNQALKESGFINIQLN
jgi:hypothetical protein